MFWRILFIVNHLAGVLLRTISMEIWTHYNSLKTQIKPQHSFISDHLALESSCSAPANISPLIYKPYSKNLPSTRHNNQYHNEGFCDFTSHSVQALSGQSKNLTFLSYLHLIRVMANTGSQLTDSDESQQRVFLRGWKCKCEFPIISRYFPLPSQ